MIAIDLSKPVMGSAGIEIDRPVADVFSFVVDDFFENYPRWALEVVEFKPINDNKMAVGALARQMRIEQGQRCESTFEITEIKPNELLVLEGLSDPYRHNYYFKPLGENKTQLIFSFELLKVEMFMRPFEKLIRRAIDEGAQNSVENIKTLLSEDETAE